MSRSRALSEIKTTHSVSLKVLRLSAPQLSHQCPLPPKTQADVGILNVDARAGLAFPATDAVPHDFILAPVLTLPPAFGATYVGETFVCTLCANDEKSGLDGKTAKIRVSGIKVSAEMQTPSQDAGIVLDLDAADRASDESSTRQNETERHTTQRIVRWDLREEGTHVLAVTVTYTETHEADDGFGGALGGKVRTFRKLYQFVARPLLNIRTKTQLVAAMSKGIESTTVLEAQLENVSETSIIVQDVQFIERAERLLVKSLNPWEQEAACGKVRLNPRDVLQVGFLLQQQPEADNLPSEAEGHISIGLGRLAVTWKGPMGEQGSLATNSLFCKT